jgi:hypothetical protein
MYLKYKQEMEADGVEVGESWSQTRLCTGRLRSQPLPML